MLSIKKLSETGFLTEQGWMCVDKFKCSKELFKSLSVGDVIDNVKTVTDKKGTRVYVTDFIVLSHKDSDVRAEPPLNRTCSSRSVSPPSPTLDRMMYGQAVNLAFDFKSKSYDYSGEDEFIAGSFDLADKIYVEYSKRVRR